MTGRGPTDHIPYIQVVVGELEALDIRTSGLVDRARDPYFPSWHPLHDASLQDSRATAIIISNWAAWPWCENDDMDAEVMWDEECGWTVRKSSDPGSHGMTYVHWDLGLVLVPDPTVVALRVEEIFNTKGNAYLAHAHRRRDAASYDPQLEMTLAYYRPT